MREIIIRREAELDIAEAFCWYEEQQPGLGFEFNIALDASLTSVLRHPESAQLVYLNVRRQLLRRFPYGVFYTIESDKIIVLAVFHARRDPESWPEAAGRAD